MAVLLAVSVTATPAPSVPTVVLPEAKSTPETSPPTGPVVSRRRLWSWLISRRK